VARRAPIRLLVPHRFGRYEQLIYWLAFPLKERGQMNENLDIKHDGFGKRIAWITCPDCRKVRWMRIQNFERGGKTGLCIACFNKRKRGTHWLYYKDEKHILMHDGYALVYSPNHPRAIYGGFVKRAVLVMEEKLGRQLEHTEHIHHLNGKRDDDRMENLTIVTNSEHARLHMKAKPNIKNKYQVALSQ
jgi:hypothetical protein